VDEGAHLAATPAVPRLHSGNCFTTSSASSAHTNPDTLETRLELAERGDNPVTSPERSPSSGNYSLTSNESSGPVIPSP
jgi:hypothetical protein